MPLCQLSRLPTVRRISDQKSTFVGCWKGEHGFHSIPDVKHQRELRIMTPLARTPGGRYKRNGGSWLHRRGLFAGGSLAKELQSADAPVSHRSRLCIAPRRQTAEIPGNRVRVHSARDLT